MAWKVVVRSITVVAAVCCLAGLGAGRASAQSVTASPTHVSLGVPAVLSASPVQSVNLVVTGGDGPQPINVTGVSIAPISQVINNVPDFAVTSDNCTGVQITSPGVCTVGLTFTPQAAGLRKATLIFSYKIGNSVDTLMQPVPLNGAAGAIKLFDSMLVEQSLPNWPVGAGKAVKSNTLSLTCTAPITAILSSSPDGTQNLFEDNYIRLTSPNTAQANVCRGGLNTGEEAEGTTNCFAASPIAAPLLTTA